MPNAIRPSGLSPVKTGSGAPYNGKANTYFIPAADVIAYYVGDLVKSAAGADVNGVPAVQKSASGDTAAARGVIVGIAVVSPTPSQVGTTLTLESYSIPATKAKGYYVLVDDDPETIFAVQDDGLAALTASSANKNISLTVAAPTNPVQLSASVLTTSTVAVTATLQLKLLGLKQSIDNAFGVNATWLVKINNHELGGPTLGV
jgi:hypothetical protein